MITRYGFCGVLGDAKPRVGFQLKLHWLFVGPELQMLRLSQNWAQTPVVSRVVKTPGTYL